MSHPDPPTNAPGTPAELAALLAPLPGDDPCGVPLRYDPVYDAIREARRADDPALPQGTWKAPLKKADWSEVRRLCSGALAERSKDLQIAVWLSEAWIHLDGFAGARRGFGLLRGLVETSWDGLHPRVEDDDLGFRLAPLEWADGRLELALGLVPLTDPQDDGRRLTFADWRQALFRDNLERRKGEDERGEDSGGGHLTADAFLLAASLTPPPRFRGHLTELTGLREEMRALEAALEGPCGDATPRLTQLKECVDELLRLVRRVLGPEAEEALAEATSVPPGEPHEGDDPMPETAHEPASPGGPVTSRAEAYRRLEEAADYLLRTEPHSPVPYLIKRAVAWGGLSLADLLKELAIGGSDLEAVYRLLGISDERH